MDFPINEQWGMREGSNHLMKNKNGLHDLSTFLEIVLYMYLNGENVDYNELCNSCYSCLVFQCH